MLGFKRGNPSKLEGKALIYVHNLEHKNSPEYPTLLLGPLDTDQFLLKDYNNIPEVIKQIMKVSKEDLEKRIKKVSSRIIPMSVSCIPVDDEKDIEDIDADADIIDAGTAENMLMAKHLLDSMAHIYMVNYQTQLRSLKTDKAKKESAEDNYKNYGPKELQGKLYFMIGNLLTSIDDKEKQREKQITNEIRAFMQDYPIQKDIDNLIGVAKTGYKRKIELITDYMEKIVEIHSENYDKVKEINKKIEKLNKNLESDLKD